MPAFGSDERRLLHESLQDFLGTTYTFDKHRGLVRAGAEGPRARWNEYARLGWLGMALPEDVGGAGGGMTELGILMSACGQGLMVEPLLQTLVLGAGAIELAGTPAQRADLLPKVADGSLTLALAHGEPDGGFDRGWVRTVATRAGDGWRLAGAKTFALHVPSADWIVVSARLARADGPLGLFLVARGAAGLTLTVAPTIDGRPGAALRLSGVTVAPGDRIGADLADQTAAIESVLDRGAIAVCAEACGAMSAVNALTLDYTKQRRQFGQPLASFQVLQHRMVDMSIAFEETRALVHAALTALDEGKPEAGRLVATAKVQSARAARFVGGQGVQLHGGMGMTDELAVGHYYKRLMACEAMFGDADWWLDRLARM